MIPYLGQMTVLLIVAGDNLTTSSSLAVNANVDDQALFAADHADNRSGQPSRCGTRTSPKTGETLFTFARADCLNTADRSVITATSLVWD